MKIIDMTANLTSLEELWAAVDQFKNWADANKIDTDTIYLRPGAATHLTLREETLTDGSKVVDLVIDHS